jgi:prepilin-type N-terminal cleavage/methylation domain-containing protein
MHGSEKGFTLMELMVVIVIVAILAAVAVPLYINYVKDAQRTEAKAAIGAIATAEQAYFLKVQSANPGEAATYGSLPDLEAAGLLDIRDAKVKWAFEITNTSNTSYTVTATYQHSNPVIGVVYTYNQGTTGGVFTDLAP